MKCCQNREQALERVLFYQRSRATEIPYDRWFKSAQNKLKKTLTTYAEQRSNPAKNIIFFLGDGMGISTLTAARYPRT